MINNITSYFNPDGTPTEEGIRYFRDRERRVAEQIAALEAQVAGMFGVGQTWQNVSGSRAHSTSYQNTTGKPIMASIGASGATTRSIQVSTDDATWIAIGGIGSTGAGETRTLSFVVPHGHYYRVNGSTTITVWAELR